MRVTWRFCAKLVENTVFCYRLVENLPVSEPLPIEPARLERTRKQKRSIRQKTSQRERMRRASVVPFR